ncbi:MAG: glycosyltransferase family 4 protein [Thaumarchaeota archaeon]|nr:MAG: glycosyltransferase family 4 protein [Nitrososphaerota archaeon]
MRGSDVLVQPSLIEGISSTLLEAMACKTSIIATKIGGNKEVLEHNKSGILVDPDSNQMLSEILDLVSNKQKAENLKKEAFIRVHEYDWSYVGILYLGIYESLLQ